MLIAEDDRDIRELMSTKLRQEGHTVTAVCDGRGAVEAVREERPDIAVLDVMMPGMSGLEAREVLRADPRTAELPIILVTARLPVADLVGDLDDLGPGPRDDAYVYVTKPFSPRELAQRVAAALARAA